MLTGTFDNVTPGYTVNYGTGAGDLIKLTALPVAGDFNNNGTVDAADYVTVRKNNGSTMCWQTTAVWKPRLASLNTISGAPISAVAAADWVG